MAPARTVSHRQSERQTSPLRAKVAPLRLEMPYVARHQGARPRRPSPTRSESAGREFTCCWNQGDEWKKRRRIIPGWGGSPGLRLRARYPGEAIASFDHEPGHPGAARVQQFPARPNVGCIVSHGGMGSVADGNDCRMATQRFEAAGDERRWRRCCLRPGWRRTSPRSVPK